MAYSSSPCPGGHITTCDRHFQKHAWPYPRSGKITESEALGLCKNQATSVSVFWVFLLHKNPPLSSDLWVWELWCLKDSSDATKHDSGIATHGPRHFQVTSPAPKRVVSHPRWAVKLCCFQNHIILEQVVLVPTWSPTVMRRGHGHSLLWPHDANMKWNKFRENLKADK